MRSECASRVWHLHLANENLTRFGGKFLPLLSPRTLFKVTRAAHPSPMDARLASSPCSTTLLCPATFDIGYISLEQQTRGIFDHDCRGPRAIYAANRHRHSHVIGFYVMLSSRELRADLFSVGVSPRYSDQSLDLELIKCPPPR